MDPQLVNYNGQLINLNGGVLSNKFPIRDGLVVYADAGIDKSYPDGGSAWNDLSPSGLDGTITNSPTFNNVNGGSLTFDGIDDYCLFGPNATSLPTSLQDDPNFTVCGWFRIPESFANQSIWSIGTAGVNNAFETYNHGNTDEIALDKWGGPTLGCGELFSKTDWKFICWRKIAGALQTSSLTIDVNTSSFTGSDLTIIRGSYYNDIPTIGNGSVGVGTPAANQPTIYNAPVEVGNFMVFDRVITDEEVAFLYNHQKQRFGHIIEDGLVLNLDAASEYSYPGTGTTWSDISPTIVRPDATLVNGPTYQSEPAAIVFDGVDDYVDIDDSDTGNKLDIKTGDLTISVWAKYDTIPSSITDYLVSKAKAAADPSRFGVGLYPTGKPFIFLCFDLAYGDMQTIAVDPIETNVWYNLTYVVDRDVETKIYVNGQQVSVTNNSNHSNHFLDQSSVYVDSSFVYRVGGYPAADGTSVFRATDGKIAEVQQYNRALTDDEIAYNFEARRGRYGI